MRVVNNTTSMSGVKKTPKPKPIVMGERKINRVLPKLKGDPGTTLEDYKLDLMKLE